MKVRLNRQQKWAYIEHGLLGMYTISHRWYWGYGRGLQYFRSCKTNCFGEFIKGHDMISILDYIRRQNDKINALKTKLKSRDEASKLNLGGPGKSVCPECKSKNIRKYNYKECNECGIEWH